MAAQGAGSLQFTISGKQIRDFKTAVQSLGKIGSCTKHACDSRCMWRPQCTMVPMLLRVLRRFTLLQGLSFSLRACPNG
jgi:hypothetical protein